MNNILKIVKSLENSGLLLRVSETIKNEAKEQKGGFLSILLDTLGASVLRNMLAVKKELSEQEKELLEFTMDLKNLHLKKIFDSAQSIKKL